MAGKSRIVWYVAYVVVGATMLALGLLNLLGKGDEYWCGIGGGLIGVGALRLVQEVRQAKDPTYAKKVEIRNTDERNVFVAGKSAQTTFKLSMLLLLVANIVLRPLGHESVANVLGIVVGLELVMYWACYLVMSRTY